jgi:hypothetical protein
MRHVIPAVCICICLGACSNKTATTANAPHATVTLRNGSIYTGLVTATSPAQITLGGDDNQTRTIDMLNVRTVEYSAPAVAQTPPGEPGQPDMPPPDATHDTHYHPQQSAITTRSYGLPTGTRISVRNEEAIDSARAVDGQTFAAEVTRDVLDPDGGVVIPRGSNAQIVIRSAARGGHFKGQSDLVLDLASVSIDGRQYQLETADMVRTGKQGVGANRRTAKFAGGGAAIGAVIGAIAGHGRGAAIGAASGAGAGLTTEVLTKGHAVRVPVESILTFRLDAPLRVAAR